MSTVTVLSIYNALKIVEIFISQCLDAVAEKPFLHVCRDILRHHYVVWITFVVLLKSHHSTNPVTTWTETLCLSSYLPDSQISLLHLVYGTTREFLSATYLPAAARWLPAFVDAQKQFLTSIQCWLNYRCRLLICY